MVNYDDFIFSSGPWSSLDKFLYSHQASELFFRLYGIYAERINDEFSLCYLYEQAYSLGVLVFLDNHPELHCNDYVERATCDFNGDDSGQISDDTSAAILLTLYALIKCKKRKTLVTAMFADKIYKTVSEQLISKESLKDVRDWPQRVSDIVEDIHEKGGLHIDLVAMGLATYEDIVEGLDKDFECDSSWTKEDFKRYIRLGRDTEEQSRIYIFFKKKVDEVSRTPNSKFIDLHGDRIVDWNFSLYIPEFALPEYYEFQSYLTLGAVDPEEEGKSVCTENQKESCDDKTQLLQSGTKAPVKPAKEVEFESSQAQKYWRKLREAGYVDNKNQLMFKIEDNNLNKAAYIALRFNEVLRPNARSRKWAYFKKLWRAEEFDFRNADCVKPDGNPPREALEIDKCFS